MTDTSLNNSAGDEYPQEKKFIAGHEYAIEFRFSKVDPYVCDEMNEGYTSTFTLNGAATDMSAAVLLSGSTYRRVKLTAAESSDTFTVVPKNNLTPGTYTATVTVSGVSVTAQSFNVSFTVNAIPVTITSVDVTPETASVQKGNTQSFSATVNGTGSYDNTVTWTVEGGVAGTTISSSGLLTVAVGETASTLTVKATANGDNTKFDTATVTVTEIPVTKYPVTVNNGTGGAEYEENDTVTITANAPAVDKVFDKWIVNSGSVTLSDINAASTSFTMPAGAVTLKANWSYNGGGDSSSSSGGGSIIPILSISAADGEVGVYYNKSGDSVSLTIPNKKVEEIISKSTDGVADIDVSGVKNATSAEMPKEALTAFGKADLAVTIKMPEGSVTLNKEAVNSIAGQVKGDIASIELMSVKPEALSNVQKKSVKAGDIVLDINIYSNKNKISEFTGELEIQILYNGPQPVAVWYLNDAGELEKLECSFKNSVVTFRVNHLSLYVLG